MYCNKALRRHLRIFSVVILFFFSFQITFHDQALARETTRLNQTFSNVLGLTVESLNEIESWEDLFDKLSPLPSHAKASLKTMLYEMVPENYVEAYEETRGLCARSVSWLLQRLGDIDKQQADIVAGTSIWAVEVQSKACAKRALRKIDDLSYPLIANVLPEMSWDGTQLSIGNEVTLTVSSDTTLSVDGTHAKIDFAEWQTVLASPTAFANKIANLKHNIGRIKTSGISELILPSAYAAFPFLLGVLLALVLMALGIMLAYQVSFNKGKVFFDQFNAKIRIEFERRERGEGNIAGIALVTEYTAYFRADKSYGAFDMRPSHFLVPRNNRREPGFFIPRGIYYEYGSYAKLWVDCTENLVELIAEEPEALLLLLQFFKNHFIQNPQGLRRDMLEALYHIYGQIAEKASDETIRKKAEAAKDHLSKMPVCWYQAPPRVA